MWKRAFVVLSAILMGACASQDNVVYSQGFSFAHYDYLIMARRDQSAVYGMDLQLSNLVSRQGMHVLGDKEYENLSYEAKKRTLGAELNVTGDGDRILLGLSLQDFMTGRTVATLGIAEKADLFDRGDREKAFAQLAESLSAAMQRDRRLTTPVANSRPAPAPSPSSSRSSAVTAPAATESEADRPYILEPDFSD